MGSGKKYEEKNNPHTVTVQLAAHAGGSRSGQWKVNCSTHGHISNHRTKSNAMSRARQHARGLAGLALLKVQNTDGTWRTEARYPR